ncbi:hypothetical protein ALQ37_200199 [Pseudomonas syringae pv. aptata]|uniref:Uncharacterized protein n=1 Tax=Pseudomonas syringae pv. aptata TaxID=83167 RepID=A0A3M3X7P6_PSEAP|nr:hypothetical protein [Pseudomonas syringae]RMO65433.1 hypothetical protein ALQ37_200199 [Pseudomonas syringae pv. aptata]
MKTQLETLNDKGIFFAEEGMLGMRLRVKLLHELDERQLILVARKLRKLTAAFGMSPKFQEGFWVPNDSISVVILKELSDELEKKFSKVKA